MVGQVATGVLSSGLPAWSSQLSQARTVYVVGLQCYAEAQTGGANGIGARATSTPEFTSFKEYSTVSTGTLG